MTNSISKLYLQADFADVHFEFSSQSERVPAHEAMLAVASPVFQAMFFGPLKESKVVEIVDASVSEFKEFLQFFYLPEVTLTTENIKAIAFLADKYDMLKYLNSCVSFLESHITEENLMWGYQLAIWLNNEKLKHFCEHQIQWLSDDVLESKLQQCGRESLKHILQLDALTCKEFKLFHGCNLKRQLGDCFYLIRFGEMTIDEFGDILSNKLYSDLFTKDELAEIMRLKSRKNFTSEIFTQTPRLPALKWDSNKMLTYNRRDSATGTKTFIQDVESTMFSTNVPLLLGKLEFGKIWHRNIGYIFRLNINILVAENRPGPATESRKINQILHTEMINFSNNKGGQVVIRQPIIIRPKIIYEIRSEYLGLPIETYFHCLGWDGTVNLDGEASIHFHGKGGLISALSFNRI